METFIKRNIEIAKWNVSNLKIDLTGLNLLTECASKAYGFLPFVAALAGAKVSAVGRTSSYGTFDDNKHFIQELLKTEGIENRVRFYDTIVPDEVYSQTDIITNSGFLRPIQSDVISKLKKTAVIPLMWETWEFRGGEIDIEACQKAQIPVIGTDEHFKDADMFAYPGMLCLKMLFEAGLEVACNKIVLLGAGLTGRLIAKTLKNNGIDFIWFGSKELEENDGMFDYSDLPKLFDLKRLDAIVVADHVYNKEIIGECGFVNFNQIKKQFPYSKLCHICGNIDVRNLISSGMFHFPDKIKTFGYMSYETINLGWEPVIMLGSAGLKVGEIAAKSRLAGLSIEESILKTVEYGIGMDFEGGFMNFRV